MKVRWKSSRSFEGKERNRFHPKGRKMDGAYFQRDPPFSIRTQQNFIRSTFARLSSASRSATFFFFFLTAWDGITWEFFHDLRVSRGEICVRAFFSLFLLSFSAESSNRKISSFEMPHETTLFAFRAQFQESAKRE